MERVSKILNSRALLAFGTILTLALLLPTVFQRISRTDLGILLKAGSRLEQRQAVYDLTDANEHTKPPLATLLFVPLSRLSEFWIARVWDLINILLYLGLAFFFAKVAAQNTAVSVRTLALLGILFTLNSWNAEVRLGQYNILTMAAILFATFYNRVFLRGFLVLFALILKPTNILFLPWMAKWANKRGTLILSTIAAFLALSSIYILCFGREAFVQDHLTWLQFLAKSSAKHMHRKDNYSLVRLFLESGSETGIVPWVLLTATLLFGVYYLRSWLESFVLSCFVCVLLTHMAWFQNYVLLLPAAIFLWSEALSHSSTLATRRLSAIGLASLYTGLQLYNPTFTHSGFWGKFTLSPIPLYAVLICLAALLPLIFYFSKDLRLSRSPSCDTI